jgi:hypothetical protein
LILQLGAYPISPLFDPHDSLRTRDTEYHISMAVALAAGVNAAAINGVQRAANYSSCMRTPLAPLSNRRR